jgi:nucleoside-diphosphate-sugar epimerase
LNVFLTGATGFIGSRLIPELLEGGHQVLGLTRSDEGARALLAAGAQPHPGDLVDLDSLRRGAAQADAVIHCAFDHDFSNYLANCEKDKAAIAALGSALIGTSRPLVITSATALGSSGPGRLASEEVFDQTHPIPRVASELGGAALVEQGVNVSVVRLPQVHDTVQQGLVTPLAALFREKGVSAYLGDGSHRWSATHVDDAVKVYRLALEKATPGARYHAVAEEGVSMREVAEALGRGLKVPVKSLPPEQAVDFFGWLAIFASLDMAASSELTRELLGWNPTGPGLLEDLDQMDYSAFA